MRHHRTVVTCVLSALALSFAASAFADGPVCLTAGVTRSTLFEASRWSGGFGYRVGASVALPVFAGVTFEPEIAWTRRTTVTTSTVDSGMLKSRIALQYLEAPLLVKRPLIRRARFAPLVLGGVYYAANLTANVLTEAGGQEFSENARSEVKRQDAGWVAGAGVQFQRAARTWSVEVRYMAGFKPINLRTTPDEWRTRSLTTTVGMKW